MAGSFAGKVALVTGASRGIGRATALAFAREGARVVIADIDTDGGDETVSMIGDAGGAGVFVHTDVSRPVDVEAMVRAAATTFGRLDYAFNNAGIGGGRMPLAEIDPETWERVISVNLTGVWLCMKYEIREMLRQGSGGAIVNNSSVAGLRGSSTLGAYVASKHGVLGLTKTAAVEYIAEGIRINAVCPGWIETSLLSDIVRDREMLEAIKAREPIGRLGQPSEVAEAVLWLCSEAASFLVGHALVADGGLSA